jgi:hypothetical protein
VHLTIGRHDDGDERALASTTESEIEMPAAVRRQHIHCLDDGLLTCTILALSLVLALALYLALL